MSTATGGGRINVGGWSTQLIWNSAPLNLLEYRILLDLLLTLRHKSKEAVHLETEFKHLVMHINNREILLARILIYKGSIWYNVAFVIIT